MMVRYSKYLVNDYYAEFEGNLRSWAAGLRLAPPAPERVAAAARARDLQRLYLARVLPDEVLAILNHGLEQLEHEVPAGAMAAANSDPEGYRIGQVGALVASLGRRLLNVSESPTTTRFFTFRVHIESALLLVLLDCVGCANALLQVRSVSPRKENVKRLRMVARWFRPETAQYLRRTVLCMRLTGRLHNMAARTVDRGKPPMVVRFAQGEARAAVNAEVRDIFADLERDPDLDVAAAVTAVLGTAVDLLLRFARYEAWPYRAFLMNRDFNRHYHTVCSEFLETRPHVLDVGFSAELQAMALSKGEEAQSLGWLQSAGVQSVLYELAHTCFATSLPVEREFATVKLEERSKLSHVGTVSRNMIHRRVLKKRDLAAARLEAAHAQLRSTKKRRVETLAISENPALKAPPMPGIALKNEAARASALNAYVSKHRRRLESELANDLANAERAVTDATPPPEFPCTQGGWAALLEGQAAPLRARFTSAMENRKSRSRRMSAKAGLPAGCPRLQPKVESAEIPFGSWAHTLDRRQGWFAVMFSQPRVGAAAAAHAEVLLLFLVSYEGRTSCLCGGAFPATEALEFPPDWAVSSALLPLSTVYKQFSEEHAVAVLEVVVVVKATADGLEIRIADGGARRVEGPLLRRRQHPVGEGESGDEAGPPRAPAPADAETDGTVSADTDADSVASSSTESGAAGGVEGRGF